MTINDLAPEDREVFDRYFYKNEQVAKMVYLKRQYESERNYVEALKTARAIDEIRERTFNIWIAEMQEKAEKIDLNKSGIPDSAKEQMNILYVTTFIACDIIESAVLDMNDLLKKYDKTLSVEMFDDIKKLSDNAKEKLKFFQRNSGYLNSWIWGAKCDDLYLMAQNKAKKIIKKNKEDGRHNT